MTNVKFEHRQWTSSGASWLALTMSQKNWWMRWREPKQRSMWWWEPSGSEWVHSKTKWRGWGGRYGSCEWHTGWEHHAGQQRSITGEWGKDLRSWNKCTDMFYDPGPPTTRSLSDTMIPLCACACGLHQSTWFWVARRPSLCFWMWYEPHGRQIEA